MPKRQWKVDKSASVGSKQVWKGNPEKLPAPWIVVDYRKYFSTNFTLREGYYYYIEKLTNLEWLEHQLDKVH